MREYRSAGLAYNAALGRAIGDVCVFVHQDVFLPEYWDLHLERAIESLDKIDSNWGVLGVYGIGRWSGRAVGHVYCTGLGRCLGRAFQAPEPVGSLDELLLVVRKGCGIVFDGELPGFHMYGTDICLQALDRGITCYAISAFCIHNTAGRVLLPWSFWRAYDYMRRKWRAQLPVRTPCVTITRGRWPIVEHTMRSLYARYLKGERPGKRFENVENLCEAVAKQTRLDLSASEKP